MAHYFIDRPIFAWVIAIGIMLAGALAMQTLPISRYPQIAPPSVSVSANYPGASAQTVQDSVTQVIEQKLTGLSGLRYMSSNSTSDGSARVQLTFETGTDADLAQVQVQNKLQQAIPLLPQSVQTQGVSVTKSGDEILMVWAVIADDPKVSATDLGDYIGSNMQTQLSRVPGVGSVTLFGAQYAMRIWLDPARLTQYRLTPADVRGAIQAQNTQVSVGQLGALPAVQGQQLNATITAQSQLQTAQQFRDILMRTSEQGAVVRLGDVARVEVGSESYNFQSRFNGQPSAGVAIYLATGANATQVAAAVNAEMAALQRAFPLGMSAHIAYDTTPFIDASIAEVAKTLVEAVLLVCAVMFLFLQNWRATLIPTLAVPIVLLGTLALLSAFGYSINTLTMFAMVLAIGLLVDDAIVVVENVERLMNEEGLSPLEATRKSMTEITGALVGVGLVLSAVFVPMAFFGGTTGVIYRQFSITIVSAMSLSVLVAVIITPAMCATMLKPVAPAEPGQQGHGRRRGLFGWFNRGVDRTTDAYESLVARMLKRGGRFMLVYVGLAVVLGLMFVRLPSSFVPDEDQGVLMIMAQLPAGATQARTLDVLGEVENYFKDHEQATVASTFTVAGFGLGSSGQNTGMGFVRLKDWSERTEPAQQVEAIQRRAMAAFSRIQGAMVFALAPPSIPGLGASAGFSLELQDLNAQGHNKLMAASRQLVRQAAGDAQLLGVRISGPDDTPQYVVDVDNRKAGALGISVSDLNSVLSIAWGGSYVNDFLDRGRVKKVFVQGEAADRMLPQDLNEWSVRNANGQMVSFAAFSSGRWTTGAPQLSRFNGIPSMSLQGSAAPGLSSGVALDKMESMVEALPGGFGAAWSGLSFEERAVGSGAAALYVLSMLVVFLCLAALYESWSVPFAVLLVVPLGVLGTVLATELRGLANDVYFQVGLLTIIGLSAKNAILIVEFAKDAVDRGQGVIEATLHAARLRLRPIVMTSLAFGLGVLPLALGSGPGSGSQHAVGTGVIGGMVSATLLGVFFIPLLYVLVYRLFTRKPKAPSGALVEAD